MKPASCFEQNKALEEAERRSEERKRQAIERLLAKLDCPKNAESFGRPMTKEQA